jgi:uncharacterized protein involved in oxidation of intracellular sulfur
VRDLKQANNTLMKLAIVISTSEPETVFNALRLGNFAAQEGDEVGVFLLGQGVELDKIADGRFDVQGQAQALLNHQGRIMACGTCLKLRDSGGSELCPLSTMKDLYGLIRDADRVVSF